MEQELNAELAELQLKGAEAHSNEASLLKNEIHIPRRVFQCADNKLSAGNVHKGEYHIPVACNNNNSCYSNTAATGRKLGLLL